ncbi:hypothetical protein Trydic_g19241 [Trypoxylus dichotomus]
MDESRIHHYDVDIKIQSKEWTHPGSLPPRQFELQSSAGNVKLSTFWNAKGANSVDFLQREAIITAAYYANLILKLRDLIKEKRREK